MYCVFFVGLFRSDLFEGLCAGHSPQKCKIRGKGFLTTNARHTKYCSGYAPGDTLHRTWRQNGNLKGREYGKVREDVREILNTLCKYKNVEIIAGAVCVDHVHLSVAIPPKLSVSDFMGYLKGKSTLMLYDRHPELQSKWDKAFWARGYYVETIGNITDEAIQKYIKEQAEESRKEDSRSTALQRTSKNACDTALWGEQ